jgi:Holliday junction resolvasome RuvABC endonuclease subunit
MYALGLDPNTKETGWCLLKNNTYTSGVIVPSNKDLHPWEAMAIAVMWFIYDTPQLDRGHSRALDFIAVEGVYHDKNVQTTIKLSKLVGAISAYGLFEGVPSYVLPTATIDRSLGILGDRKRGNKNLGQMIIGKGKTEHEYDAWAVLHVGMGVHKENGWKEAG